MVKKDNSVKQLAMTKVAEGVGAFLDPASPSTPAQEFRMKFASPVLVVFTVPIVIAFFFAQKTFIQGVKLTGMKE